MHAWDESESVSVHFVHTRRHIFTWQSPYDIHHEKNEPEHVKRFIIAYVNNKSLGKPMPLCSLT